MRLNSSNAEYSLQGIKNNERAEGSKRFRLGKENQRIRTAEPATTPWAGITEGRRGNYQNPERTDC